MSKLPVMGGRWVLFHREKVDSLAATIDIPLPVGCRARLVLDNVRRGGVGGPMQIRFQCKDAAGAEITTGVYSYHSQQVPLPAVNGVGQVHMVFMLTLDDDALPALSATLDIGPYTADSGFIWTMHSSSSIFSADPVVTSVQPLQFVGSMRDQTQTVTGLTMFSTAGLDIVNADVTVWREVIQ